MLRRIAAGTYRESEIDVDAENARFLTAMKDIPWRRSTCRCRRRAPSCWPPGRLKELTPAAEYWLRKAGPDHVQEHLPAWKSGSRRSAPWGAAQSRSPTGKPARLDTGGRTTHRLTTHPAPWPGMQVAGKPTLEVPSGTRGRRPRIPACPSVHRNRRIADPMQPPPRPKPSVTTFGRT